MKYSYKVFAREEEWTQKAAHKRFSKSMQMNIKGVYIPQKIEFLHKTFMRLMCGCLCGKE